MTDFEDDSAQQSNTPPALPRRSTQANSRLGRLCQKELRETLRDRRTIVTLLLMPLLVYPLLSMALNRYLISAVTGTSEAAPYTIGVATDEEGNLLAKWLESPFSTPPDAILAASNGRMAKFVVFNTYEMTDDSTGNSPGEALKKNMIDLACKIETGRPPTVLLTAFNGDVASESAQRIVAERLQWLRLGQAEATATALAKDYVPPADVKIDSVGEVESPNMLGTIVPLVLVLMTITGAVYPAIDLTAGERERGTMESLMASPVPRSYILFSKYVAVVVVALLTAIANLLAMFTTLWAGGLLQQLTGTDSFPWLAVLQILGLLVLFSGFFAALLLSLTSFARSFKEAQAYLIPIMLLSLTPGMLSLMPGVTLNGPLAIAPLINIVLLAREVLQGTAESAPAMITILSTVGYAAAAIAVASKLFGSDAVTRTSQQSFGSLLKRPTRVSDAPSPQTAALMLALLVPIYYVTSNVLIRWVPELSFTWVLLLNVVASVLTFGLIPLLAVAISRSRFWTTYRFAAPHPLALIGALLTGLGAWGFAHESFVIAEQLGMGGLDLERIQKTQQTVDAMKTAPAWLLVACLALAPAIIEEFCFRGVLFSALGKVLSPGRLIVTTAVIFGLFHVVTGNILLVERFIPTTLLGLILGWIAYRTGSVWPGVLMHLTHNGLLNLAIKYQDRVEFLGAGSEDQMHLPPLWMACLTTLTVVGLLMIWGSTRPAEDPAREIATTPA